MAPVSSLRKLILLWERTGDAECRPRRLLETPARAGSFAAQVDECSSSRAPTAIVMAARARANPLLASPDARSRARDPRPAVPARADLGRRRAAADGQAARPARAGRVLGLLPRQLAADDALPGGVARALRRCRPARDRRARRRLPAGAQHRERRRGGRAARHRLSGRDRRAAGDLGLLRQRGLARALPLGPAGRAVLAALRRGRLPGDRARDPGAARASSATSCRRCARRTPRTCCCRRRPRTSRARTPAPTRRAAPGPCSRERARSSPTGAASASPTRAATRSSSTRTTRPECSSCGSARA